MNTFKFNNLANKTNRNKASLQFVQTGFTLIELAMAVMILAILASVAIPSYQDYVDKARLVNLQLRVDAMRTAMTSAYESGELSMMSMGAGAPGQIPTTLTGVPLEDSMSYPGLQLVLMSTNKEFQPLRAINRPYLVIAADGADGNRTLRNFSEVYPESNWAWWLPSSIMVIPLIDDGSLPSPTVNTQPPTQTIVSQQPGSTTTISTPDTPASTTTPQPSVDTSLPVVFRPAASAATTVTQPCIHPGNGHAFGLCSHGH